MKILDAGHKYLLNNLDGDFYQELTFVKRQGEKFPDNTSSNPGTTMQDVLRVICDRLRYVNNQIPCKENKVTLNFLRKAIQSLENRAAKIHNRSLMKDFDEAEFGKICKTCGHVGCKGC